MSEAFSVELVKAAAPKSLRSHISEDFVNQLNNISNDPIARETIKNNALGYLSVLEMGRFKPEDYLNAIVYCTHRLSGDTQQVAYTKTFPDRYKRFLADTLNAKQISAYVSMYNKNKLVELIMERAMTPVWLLNADIYQDAINTQAEIMATSRSDMARVQAANSLLTHLKKPETAKIDISVKDESQESALTELRRVTQDLAIAQRRAIESGTHTTKDIAHSKVITGEYEEVDNK